MTLGSQYPHPPPNSYMFTFIMLVQMCKHTAQQATLFYMPHCGKAMYNNLLWANWNPTLLSQIAIVGNRFSSYNER